MKFEWNEQKNALINFRNHGVWFEDACYVFSDPSAFNKFDLEHSESEERWLLLGSSPINGNICLILHTYRETNGVEMVRFISARKATRDEQQAYFLRRKT